MSSVFVYVMAHDYGFAPNPFFDLCTLATCKPQIRKSAVIGDWVVEVGGGALHATGRCVFAMQVTDKLTFNEYWTNPKYKKKKAVRDDKNKTMVGDNIYHRDPSSGEWLQAPSHHSNADGTTNDAKLKKDTDSDAVLISDNFYYFGKGAPLMDNELSSISFKNARNYRKFDLTAAQPLIDKIVTEYASYKNQIMEEPIDFVKIIADCMPAPNE